MASSNIKLFDENKGNMLTDTEFNISTQRLNGLQTGVASSQLQNKAMYQASLVAYAIAQIMLQNGLNANDTDAVSAFVANLSGTLLQKVHDIATTEEAQAGVATGKWMSPALVKAAIDYTKATTEEARTGTDDTKWMSSSKVMDLLSAKKCTYEDIIAASMKAFGQNSGIPLSPVASASGSFGVNAEVTTATITIPLTDMPDGAKCPLFNSVSVGTGGGGGSSASLTAEIKIKIKDFEKVLVSGIGNNYSAVVNAMNNLQAYNFYAESGIYLTNQDSIILEAVQTRTGGSSYAFSAVVRSAKVGYMM